MGAPKRTDLRAGMRLSALSVTWTVITGAAAIAAGAFNGSLVLVVFGLTGILDGAGSFVLALHFRHALRRDEVSPAHERLALRVVGLGLISVGAVTIVESVRRLLAGTVAEGSPVGLAIAVASVVVLAVLTLRKREVARRVRSDALMADSWLSATGAGLAIIALVGTALEGRSDARWVDPATALVVALIAASLGVVELRREASALTDRRM